MKKQRSSIIGSVDELSQALGDSYVLFIGSAVSGRMPPYLPMVDDFRDGVLEGLSGSLSGDHYYEALLKKYSESLINGHHQHVARQTKFEEFLWFIQTLAGKDKLDDLLFRLYVCSSEECGPNQVAIATLLNSSKCAACFTTNFDNTIELVCPEIRTYIFSEDHPHSFPQVLPKRGAPPIIVKLHGDARAKNCVAISPQLYRDAREQIHSYLPALLDGHRVFVLGYSGLGDIDIAPHLRNTSATFIWASHNLHELRNDIPPWSQYRACCDLSSNNEDDKIGGPRNLLLDLAVMMSENNGRNVKFPTGTRHSWRNELVNWCQTSGIDMEMLLRQFFQWRTAWPILHMEQAKINQSNRTAKYWREYGFSCTQIGAYRSALAAFMTGLALSNLGADDQIDLRQGVGFSLWRLGELNQAQHILGEALVMDFPRGLEQLRSDVCRVYLEVSRDILQYTASQEVRRSLYQHWKIEEYIRILKELPKSSPENDLLAEIVEYDIMGLVGSPVSFEKVSQVYDECENSKYQAAASACAEVLVRMSFRKGLPRMIRATLEVQKIGMWHYVYKNTIAGLNAIILKWLPWLLPVSFRTHRSWRRVMTGYMEWRFKKTLRQWRSCASVWQSDRSIDIPLW